MLIREYLKDLPEQRAVVKLHWVRDLPDIGSDVDHFAVGFIDEAENRITDTVVIGTDGYKPGWGDKVLIELRGNDHPILSKCICDSCEGCEKEKCEKDCG